DRLVDPLAVEDPSAQLLDADAEQLLVLALDLPAPGLVLRELLLRVVGVVILGLEDAERLRLAPSALVALTHARHASEDLPHGSVPCSHSSCHIPRRSLADRSRRTAPLGCRPHSSDRGVSGLPRHPSRPSAPSSLPCAPGKKMVRG